MLCAVREVVLAVQACYVVCASAGSGSVRTVHIVSYIIAIVPAIAVNAR